MEVITNIPMDITQCSDVLSLSFDDKPSTDKSRTLPVVPTSCVLAISMKMENLETMFSEILHLFSFQTPIL